MANIVTYESFGTTPVGIRDSMGHVTVSSDPAVLLHFLLFSCHPQVPFSALRATWKLDEFIAPILRTLPVDVCKSLTSPSHSAEYQTYSLYYIPNKIFVVGPVRFYSLWQFWTDDDPDPTTLEDTQRMADELLSTLSGCGIPSPTKLTSPVAVFEASEQGRMVCGAIPKDYDTPQSCVEAQDYALKCDGRQWTSNYQIGCWGVGELWDYDLAGAYPSVAVRLRDIRQFSYRKSRTMDYGAYYGFLKGRMWIYPESPYAFMSPVITEVGGMQRSPVGDLGKNYYCTLDMVRFVEYYGLGKFELQDGWFLRPYSGTRPDNPFATSLQEFYNQRSQSSLASSVMKKMANGLIGKLKEKRGSSYGPMYNPIYHSLILTGTVIRVADFLIQNQVIPDELVHVGTDGCKLTRYIPLPSKASRMGQWRCCGTEPTLVLSPGGVYAGGMKPGSLTYADIIGMIREHPMSSRYSKMVEHRTTLSQAVAEGDISKVGSLYNRPASVDLNVLHLEQDRHFAKLPKTGRQVLDGKYRSVPIELQ